MPKTATTATTIPMILPLFDFFFEATAASLDVCETVFADPLGFLESVMTAPSLIACAPPQCVTKDPEALAPSISVCASRSHRHSTCDFAHDTEQSDE